MQQVKTWLANHGRSSLWRNKWSWREGWWMSAVSSTLERSLPKPNVSSLDSLAIAWYLLQYINTSIHQVLFCVCLTVMCAQNLNKTKKRCFFFRTLWSWLGVFCLFQQRNLQQSRTPSLLVLVPVVPPQILRPPPPRPPPQTQVTLTLAERLRISTQGMPGVRLPAK